MVTKKITRSNRKRGRQKKPQGEVMTKHPLYQRWTSIRRRSSCPNSLDYKYYGGRGITLIEEWKDFWVFVDDIESTIGPIPYEGAFLDRINNDEGYYPGNMQWADPQTNCNNRTSTHELTYNGKTQSIGDWSREVGIDGRTLWSRLTYGWSEEKALTTPIRKIRKGK